MVAKSSGGCPIWMARLSDGAVAVATMEITQSTHRLVAVPVPEAPVLPHRAERRKSWRTAGTKAP